MRIRKSGFSMASAVIMGSISAISLLGGAHGEEPTHFLFVGEVHMAKPHQPLGGWKTPLDFKHFLVREPPHEEMFFGPDTRPSLEEIFPAFLVWNWKNGNVKPFVRLPESEPGMGSLKAAQGPDGKRYLIGSTEKLTKVYIGDRNGGFIRSFRLPVNFSQIYATAADDAGSLYIWGKPEPDAGEGKGTGKRPATTMKAIAQVYRFDSEGEITWSGMSQFHPGNRISMDACRIVPRKEKVYFVAGPDVRILYPETGNVQKIRLETTAGTAGDIYRVIEINSHGEFLIQWVEGAGSGRPFFNLTWHDAKGKIIRSDLIRPLLRDRDADHGWAEIAVENRFMFCFTKNGKNERHCFEFLWDTSTGTTWEVGN